MEEREVAVKTIQVQAKCEKCNGHVRYTGFRSASGRGYEHKCNTCSARPYISKIYPYIKYVEVK